MRDMTLAGQSPYSLDEARAVIAGYAFATRPFAWRPPQGQSSLGEPPGARRVPIWAYETYDQVQGGKSQHAEATDILVAAGLNGRIDSKLFAVIKAVLPEAFRALGEVPDDVTFWDLPREDLWNPPPGSHSWYLLRAWWLLAGAPGVKVARTHKVLHHKRPRLVPLIDGKTVGPLEVAATANSFGGNSWVQLHEELNRYREEFEELERWFNDIRVGEPTLFRLRLHDILLWCRVTKQDDEARRKGEQVLREANR
jgi:hypothetical protein